MPIDHLKFSPDILRRLGEELIPHADQGIVELVRNAYDADALHCSVQLQHTDRAGGTIIITDDGVGMEVDRIREGWLLIGRSSKDPESVTKLGRRPVGNKGLGRLAALRMGTSVELVSRPQHSPSIENRLVIDWERFELASTVEDVSLSIETTERKPTAPKGTEIIIRGIAKPLKKVDVERLARSIVLLADPFEHQLGFKPTLRVAEFRQLERLVRSKYFDDAQFNLDAEIDENGRGVATVTDSKKRIRWRATHDNLSKSTYRCPQASFELWMFLLGGASFAAKNPEFRGIRDWLNQFGGVHIYHRSLRVHPYGDPGYDWLDMNLRRVRSPEERPSTNNTIGRVLVDDPQGQLLEKTDRSGFVETEPFSELRRFAVDTLEWMARERLKEKESERQRRRATTTKEAVQARKGLSSGIAKLPPKYRTPLETSFRRYEEVRKKEFGTLAAEVQLYRTLSTIGTTFAVFAHEIGSPAKVIKRLARSIERRAQQELGFDAYKSKLDQSVQTILKSADELTLFPAIALGMLDRDKRRVEAVDVNAVVTKCVDLFRPLLAGYHVHPELKLIDTTTPWVMGTVAAIESIVINLITNSVNAFLSEEATQSPRTIVIRTEIAQKSLLVRVLDSGPGIRGIDVSEIWLPGRTTSEGGTGLGLTIVRDAVQDLGGTAQALAKSELGGAEIILTLPLHAELLQ